MNYHKNFSDRRTQSYYGSDTHPYNWFKSTSPSNLLYPQGASKFGTSINKIPYPTDNADRAPRAVTPKYL